MYALYKVTYEIAALLAISVLLASPRLASAQSCCGVTAEDELAVVGIERKAVVATKLAVEHMLGRHDSRGDYHALEDGVSATDAALVLGAGVRMPWLPLLQLHGALPVRVQHRTQPDSSGGDDSATLAGAGDASLFARASLLRDDERGLFAEGASAVPSLDVFAGMKAPTGAHDDGFDAHALARTRGDGVWGASLGVRALKYVATSHALRLALRYDHRFARSAEGALGGYASFSPGDSVDVVIDYLGLLGMWWAWGVSVDAVFTGRSSARSPGASALHELPGTSMRKLGLGAHVTRVLVMPELDLTVGLSYTPPIDGLSRNISWEGLVAVLTLRWQFS